MKADKIKLTILAILVLLLFVATMGCSKGPEPVPGPQPGPDPIVYPFTLPDHISESCSKAEYQISAANIDSVYGVELYINYDTSRVTFDSLTSDILDDSEMNVGTIDGVIRVVWVDRTLVNPIVVNDEVVLLTLHLSDVSDTSAISFADLSAIFDVNGDPIAIRDSEGNSMNMADFEGTIGCN